MSSSGNSEGNVLPYHQAVETEQQIEARIREEADRLEACERERLMRALHEAKRKIRIYDPSLSKNGGYHGLHG
jgi:hypothetical protein